MLQDVDTIMSILELDTLAQDSEFGSQPTINPNLVELATATTSLNSRLSEWINFVNADIQLPKVSTVSVISNTKSNAKSSTSGKLNTDTADSSNQLTTSDRKYILAKYGSEMTNLSNMNFKYTQISDCVNMISNWINSRLSRNNQGFYYNPLNIPNWISDIVIAYGNACKSGTNSEFYNKFTAWCNNLAYSGKVNKYSLPFDVFKMENMTQQDTSIYAIAIWDVILDNTSLNSDDKLKTINANLSRLTIEDKFHLVGVEFEDYQYTENCLDAIFNRRVGA